MAANLKVAIVIGVGFVTAVFLFRGLYESHASENGVFLWRTNRFTGTVTFCAASTGGVPTCTDAKSN